MKLIMTLSKTLKENIRDWKVLLMVLVFSPFFLIIMHLMYGGSQTSYALGIIDLDKNASAHQLMKEIGDLEQEDSNLFEIVDIKEQAVLEEQIMKKELDIGIVIPKGYTETIAHKKEDTTIQFYGSMGNVRYPVAAVMVADAINRQGLEAMDIALHVVITETFLEKKLPLNEFDVYVPGLITLAVLMVLFTASASIVRESDKKTLIRLKLSKLGAFNFLLGVSIVQAIIAIIALIIAYWVACLLGYQPEGSFYTVLIVGILTSFSMVSISLIVASFLNTIFDVLTVGCFPFFLLMFFSGSMFPLPKVSIFTIGDYAFGVTDILPLTHTVNAFNKILNYGAGLTEVGFDLFMIGVLTVVFFILGLFLYNKRKLSVA